MATLTAWTNQVRNLIRAVSSADVPELDAQTIGIVPALAQFAVDRPRVTSVDITASGRYLRFPTTAEGWVEAFSEIRSIEAPAGQTPPAVLLDSCWSVTRDPATPAVPRVLLPADLAGVSCRIVFSTSWPTPTTDPAVDVLGTVAFAAVTSLAAALVLQSMAAQAARSRVGALSPDYVEVTERSRTLLEAAAAQRGVYAAFIGQSPSGNPSVGAAGSGRDLRSWPVGSASRRLAGLE